MIKKRISLIITVLVLLAFAVYIVQNFDSLKELANISILVLVFIGFTKLLKFFFNGLFIQWTAEVFTNKFKLRESVYVAILSAVGNFFGPLMGGATVRAVYLKKVHKLPYSSFASTLTGYYVILFGIYSFLGAISVMFLPSSSQATTLLTFFVVWFIFMVALMFLRLPSKEKLKFLDKHKYTKYFSDIIFDIEKGWRQIVKSKKLMLRLIFIGLAGLAVTALSSYVEFRAVGVHISPAALGLHTALSATAILVSLTPGAIGIKEGILVLNSSVMNVTNEQIIAVSVIDRGMMFVVITLLYIFSKKIKMAEKL